MNVYICIIAMALTTYLIRMLPLTIFRKKINNVYAKSFLQYVPYACLAAMTVPAIFSATQSIYSAIAGLVVAVILGFFKRSLPIVALFSCLAVFITERIMGLPFMG